MAVSKKYLTYRGDLQAIVGFANGIAFTTVHPDSIPTAVYQIDRDKMELASVDLPCGGVSLSSNRRWMPESDSNDLVPYPGDSSDQTLWIGGDDGRIYRWKQNAKKLDTLKVELPSPATKLASLSGNRLAAICDEQLWVIDSEKGDALQTIDLPERGTSMGVDPDGNWLAVGTAKGTVCVFECEDKKTYQLSESEKLHEGAVTSILFEPDELRFLSAGADQKLLLTHARGALEPEDRGRGASHSDLVTSLVHVPGDRFVSCSRDKSCKTWARVGATRPATFDDAVPPVVDATVISIHDRPHLVIAGKDNSIRLVLLDAGGRFGAMTHRLFDAYERASQFLGEHDVARRGEAIHALAEYGDTRSVEMLAERVGEDRDPALRLRAVELLSASDHPRAIKLLEPFLKHDDDDVRMVALEGLLRTAEDNALRVLDLALASRKANVGTAAVAATAKLAKKDDQAMRLLIRSLDKEPQEIRQAALVQLEGVFPKSSVEPTLIGIKSKQQDTRRLSLIRAFQRGLLDDDRISGIVRRAGEDADADVRQSAFLISLLSREKLAKAVRQRDVELHRQLFELENFQLTPKTGAKAKQPPKLKPTAISLDTADYQPLLSAMSSRMVDTCLLGARCLALIGDARALGTLLQLSREDDAGARVQVCQALSALDDARAAQRLETLIDDESPQVRDAAYSALEEIHKKLPLDAADIGIACRYVEVRRRALKTLAASMRKTKSKSDVERCREMMLRALNDDDQSVSGEAFKSILGMKQGDPLDERLKFALQSVRPNVRREVLTEAMAGEKEAWAPSMLVELLSDPSSKIREDAYEYLLAKTKGRDIAPMRSGLASRYSDIRLRATESLIKLNTKDACDTLVTAIGDEEADVRGRAVTALIKINDPATLHQAMESPFSDVRLQAACARAMFQDDKAKAPLIQFATAAEPEKEADRSEWEKDAILAISGIGKIGNDEFVSILLPLLDSKHAGIRLAAAGAIALCARPAQIEELKPSLQHSDPEVQYRIALGLAFCREPIALPVVFSEQAAKVLDFDETLMATVAFGEPTETRLIGLLDAKHSWIRNAAYLILLFRDAWAHTGSPDRILAALSAQDPRIRLAAARALESFADPVAFESLIVEFVNDRGEQKDWEITEDCVRTMGQIAVHASPSCQAQLAKLLKLLAADAPPEWDFAWDIFAIRYADEIEASAKLAEKNPAPSKVENSVEELRQLAFGTYVGLVREQGGYHERRSKPAFGTSVTAIRQAAIGQLVRMSESDEGVSAATQAVLIQSLGDPLQDVRSLAFEQLAALGVTDETRAAAAIECGHTDLAMEALKLLSGAAGKKGRGVVEDVVTTRDDELAAEAAKLLLEMTDVETASRVALQSPNAAARTTAIGWLAADYENAKSRKVLVNAYQSRHGAVQRDVAIALAGKKDAAAFEMLVEQLPAVLGRRNQQRVIDAMVQSGDARCSDALLDALDADDQKSLDVPALLGAVGTIRNPAAADRLLVLLEKKETREDAASSLRKISGYTQHCVDPWDDLPNRDWLKEQHPRHDSVIAGFFEKCLELNLPNLIRPWVDFARWSLSDAVDDVLKRLAVHPDVGLRHSVVDAIGWRFRKRDGPPDALLEALNHRDADTKFLAAAGLARGGRDDGIQVLLSGIELLSDLNQRVLGVRALGELADERSLDVLLKLASEDAHALQDAAAEAIGHLGKSSKSDEVFALLERLASSGGSVADRAIVGLRWFDTPSGWDLIRAKTREDSDIAVIQLGYNDDPATRTILLDLLNGYWPEVALRSAKRVFGDDSLEPDYAVLQSQGGYEQESSMEQDFHCLARVCRDGEAAKIFEILPHTSCVEGLTAALVSRDPLPLAAAENALDSPHPSVALLAATIVGRSPKKTHAKQLESALPRWLETWNQRYEELVREGGWSLYQIDEVTSVLSRLAWVAGRAGGAKKALLDLVATNQEIPPYSDVRKAAVVALASCKLTKSDLSQLEPVTEDADADLRRLAAEVLARQDAARVAKMGGQLVSDRTILQRVMRMDGVDVSETVIKYAGHPQYQAVVLPALVMSGDVERLSDIATDAALGDPVRLGAIEGLAKMADSAANEQLVVIGNDESADEELRKAAWRGLRRAKRVQAKGAKQ